MVSYCSLSNDNLLTKILIENSNKNNLSKNSLHNFNNKNQWIDGLDIWSTEFNEKFNNFNSKDFIFDNYIGIYLPRSNQFHLKLIKRDSYLSKNIQKQILPQRLQQLIQRQDNQFTIQNHHQTNQNTSTR